MNKPKKKTLFFNYDFLNILIFMRLFLTTYQQSYQQKKSAFFTIFITYKGNSTVPKKFLRCS